jgi:hypothetical protein
MSTSLMPLDSFAVCGVLPEARLRENETPRALARTKTLGLRTVTVIRVRWLSRLVASEDNASESALVCYAKNFARVREGYITSLLRMSTIRLNTIRTDTFLTNAVR